MNEIIKIVAFGLLIAYGTGILLFFVICSAVAQRAEIVNSGHGRLVDVSIKWLSIVLLSIVLIWHLYRCLTSEPSTIRSFSLSSVKVPISARFIVSSARRKTTL